VGDDGADVLGGQPAGAEVAGRRAHPVDGEDAGGGTRRVRHDQRDIAARRARLLDAGGDGAETEADGNGEALRRGLTQGALPVRFSRPVVSSMPSIRLAFWIAWPAAPLTRLSMAENASATPRSGSASAPSSTRFVLTTGCSRTASGLAARRNGLPATKRSIAAAASAAVLPGFNRP